MAPNYHAGRLGTGPDFLVVERLLVLPVKLIPGEMVAQPYPSVALVQPLKGRTETVDGQLLVCWLKSHLLVDFNTAKVPIIC